MVEFGGRRGKVARTPVYAVFYLNVWTPVVVKQSRNVHQLAKCFGFGCLSLSYGCIHAKKVSDARKNKAAWSAAAAAEFLEQQQFNNDNMYDSDDGAAADAAPATPAPHPRPPPSGLPPARGPPPPPAGLPRLGRRRASTDVQLRRSRNMLSCSEEVRLGQMYHDMVDAAREEGRLRVFPDFFADDVCLACELMGVVSERGEEAMFNVRRAELHTTRGTATIFVCSWVCPRSHEVRYDGAQDALFAFSLKVVYTRMFLDAVIEFFIIGKSTMAAGCEFLASYIRNTGAFADNEIGRARQTLSDAVGEFSDTHEIPDCAFSCSRCEEDEEDVNLEGSEANGVQDDMKKAAFDAVIMDGQMLSFEQEFIAPMLRPTVDVPRADIPLGFASAVGSAAASRVIRNRVRARTCDVSALSAAEATAWSSFVTAAT